MNETKKIERGCARQFLIICGLIMAFGFLLSGADTDLGPAIVGLVVIVFIMFLLFQVLRIIFIAIQVGLGSNKEDWVGVEKPIGETLGQSLRRLGGF